jgi:hypothetical protein
MNYENEDTEEYFAALESLRQLSAGTWNAPNPPLGSVADEIDQSDNREIDELRPEVTIPNDATDAFKEMEVICLGSKKITTSSMLNKVMWLINSV